MNERIKNLRKQSTQTQPSISTERAKLITEFYKSIDGENLSVPVQRAKAFQYILANKKICINPGELIVGERGPAPQATPTYPEICLHSTNDLDVLNSRVKIPFLSDEETKAIYTNEIIPFWKGQTIRDKMFEELPQEWKEAYAAGVFTEFMEQRPPGHTVLDDKIYKKGMLEFINDIDLELNHFDDPLSEVAGKTEQLQAMRIAAEAIILFAERHAIKLEEIAKDEIELIRKEELIQMAKICKHVPAYAPRNFWEAIQYYWFVHVGVITEVNPWDSFNPGRLDQHLYPFYK
ncbi:MAG: pyruvate formate lyase family protein, partial [Bacteroidales bacterium]